MSGVATHIHVDGGNVTFERVQDCTAIAEHTQALSREGLHGSSEMRHAASFPMVIVEKYLNDKGITFAEFMANRVHVKAMLSDPALSAFRVWGGRV
ncbi:hypothetical protein [Undibacterium sp. TJN19]|uniref:hypothetical protein n=1 Tax=Undibacterium sp. TJN19 TaxID=3413055 RepID=UPI003BF25FC7